MKADGAPLEVSTIFIVVLLASHRLLVRCDGQSSESIGPMRSKQSKATKLGEGRLELKWVEKQSLNIDALNLNVQNSFA